MSFPRAGGFVLLGIGCWALPAGWVGPPEGPAAEARTGAPWAAPVAAQEDPRKGRLLFFRHCRTCHSETGGDAPAPDLRGLLDPAGPGTRTEESVREIIVDGRGDMSAFGDQLTNDQLDDLIAYLKTM